MITKRWLLGSNRYGTYAVMTENGEELFECGTDKELAEHIIDIHNKVYEEGDNE